MFHDYLTTFPAVGLYVVSMLLYGSVLLWDKDPQSNIMFPLCGMRCGFELLTPLAVAGNVYYTSTKTLHTWWKFSNLRETKFFISRNTDQGNEDGTNLKLVKMAHRSCSVLECWSGPLFSFGRSIFLATINVIIQLTVNTLVTFPNGFG